MTKEDIGERVARVETKIDALNEKLDTFIQSAERKFASKYVETFFWLIIGGLVTAGGLLLVNFLT